jgi:MFS family permease
MEDEESINPEAESKPSRVYLSTTLSILVIIQLAGLSFVTSFTNGILTVGLPTIARDILLPPNLLLWPSTVGFLATASFLLLGGGVSDAAGPKLVNLLGCVLLTASTLGCGLAHSGIQLIVFRALQGLAYALAYPSSTAIVSLHIRSGPARNVGFACIGFAMCIGFAGGLFVGALGWRAGLYAGAGISLILLGLGALTLPSDSRTLVRPASLENLMNDVDWIGAGIGTAFLALISTVLA